MARFESKQVAWEYYLNLDSHHFAEKQHNNIYTDAFEAGVEWADKHPNSDTIKSIFEFALNNTNFLIAYNLDAIDWDKLVKQAMEE